MSEQTEGAGSPLLQATASLASRLTITILDLLMPIRCVVCNREGGYLCDGCEERLPRLREPYCEVCADPGESPVCRLCAEAKPAVDGVRAPYLMDGPVRQMVYDLKYRNMRAVAPTLACLMGTVRVRETAAADMIVPVPMHRRRERARGYNQSDLLARGVALASGLPVQPATLRRIRDTPPQVSLADAAERRANMEGAFECPGDVRDTRVLLVDDVVTTGSTVVACAAALKEAGASSVWALALARQA